MSRLRPGWLVALFAATASASAWLPWLTTGINGGGWAQRTGGGGRRGARGLFGTGGIGGRAGDLAAGCRADGVVLPRQRQAAGVCRIWALRRWRRRGCRGAVLGVGVGVVATRPSNPLAHADLCAFQRLSALVAGQFAGERLAAAEVGDQQGRPFRRVKALLAG